MTRDSGISDSAWHESWHDARIRAVTGVKPRVLALYCLVVVEALLGFTENRFNRILKRGE
jgi:hypothetical protein